MSEIDDLRAQEGMSAENYEMAEELSAHVRAGRPHAARGTVVSVRVSDEEQRAATEANLPVSTLLRIWALDRLSAERHGAGGTVAETLERQVFQRTA